MAEEKLRACRAALAEAGLHAPSASVMAAAIASGLSTAIPGAAFNLGAVKLAGALKLFALLYALSLPLAAAASYELYQYAKRLVGYCGGRVDPAPYAAGALPFGFILPLFYTEAAALNHCKSLRGKYRVSAVDLLLNLIIMGLHVILYASVFNQIVGRVIPSSLCRE